MKALNKLYVEITNGRWIGRTSDVPQSEDSVEYIRKDCLLEWLEQELAQRRQWFERYEDVEDLHACNELTKIINKLNEM